MTDRDEDADPLLVRPYIQNDPGDPAPTTSAQTWPEAATDTPAPDPVPTPPGTPAPIASHRAALSRRRPLLLLAVALLLVLAGATAVVAAMLPESGPRTALPVDIPLPSVVVTEPAPTAPTATPPAATEATTATTPTRPTSSPTASSPPSPAATTTAPSPSSAPARTTTRPPDAQLAPPPADRAGRIHGNGDVCLDLNGAVAFDGNHIQVFTCNDTSAQVWTVAADGTLRVVGKCAFAADDGAVRIAGCDGRRSAQWRTGDNGALVNLAREDCLTDPGTGTRSGTGVRIEDCSGADRQRWQLP